MKSKLALITGCTIPLILWSSFCFAQWQQLDNAGLSAQVFCVLADGSNVYAGGGYGVFRSTDSGSSWVSSSIGMKFTSMGCQINGLTLVDGKLFAATLSGIYRSIDNGVSWQEVNSGLPSFGNVSVSKIVAKGSDLFAGTQGSGVFHSPDYGGSWSAVNAGLPFVNQFQFISSMIVNGDKIFIGTQNDGIYLSADNGNSWNPRNSGLTTANNQIHSLALNGSDLVAGTNEGVYISSNNGDQWAASNTGIPLNTQINALAVTGTSMFAGSFNGGAYFSSDNGASWIWIGLTDVLDFAFSGNQLIAGCGEGIYRSSNSGTSWTKSNTGLKSIALKALVTNGNKLFFSTDGNDLFESNNNGIFSKITTSHLNTSSIAASGDDLFYASYFGVHYLDFNGTSWTDFSRGLSDVVSLHVYGNRLFAGTVFNGVYYSESNGASWTNANNGIPSNTFAQAFASKEGHIFAGTQNNGIYVSTDQGSNWSPAANGLPTNSSISSLMIKENNLYAAVQNSGIFKSPDNGQSWQQVSNGMTTSEVTSFAGAGHLLFAGTNSGVFLSLDSGNSWTPANTNHQLPYVSSLVVSADTLYAGTHNWIWARPLSDFNPSITTLAPDSGAVGDLIQITGDNFDPTTVNNLVFFNGMQATVSASTSTTIDATVPEGATLGLVSVRVGSQLEVFSPDTFCVMPPKPLITATGLNTVSATLTSNSATGNHQWFKNGIPITGATDLSLIVNTDGVFTVKITGLGCTSIPSDEIRYCVPRPKPTITTSGLGTDTITLTSSASAGNQWFRNANLIVGATGDTLVVTEGTYTVQVIEGDCSSPISDRVFIIFTGSGDDVTYANRGVNLYPNPTKNYITFALENLPNDVDVSLEIFSFLGQCLYAQKAKGGLNLELDISEFDKGLYIVKIHQNKNTHYWKLIKE